MKQESWLNPKIETRDSPSGGKGMFAKRPIKNSEKILIWKTDYTDAGGALKAKREGKLVLQWDEKLWSVEERGDDIGYFINHSRDSNTWMYEAFTLIARKDISAGEEVTADYALWEADENYVSKWECRCGSSVCRKTITGKDWQLPEIQKKYKNHFSPLINKLIGYSGGVK